MNKKFTLLVVIACAAGCMQDVHASAPSLLTQKQPFTFNGYVYQLSVPEQYNAAQRMIDRLRQGRVTEAQVEHFLRSLVEKGLVDTPQPVQVASSADADFFAQLAALPAPASRRPGSPVAQRRTAAAPTSVPVTQQPPQTQQVSQVQMCPSGIHVMPSACSCVSANRVRQAPIAQDALSAHRISLEAKQRALLNITNQADRAIALAEIERLRKLLEAASQAEVARLSQQQEKDLNQRFVSEEIDEDWQFAAALQESFIHAQEAVAARLEAEQEATQSVLDELRAQRLAVLEDLYKRYLEEKANLDLSAEETVDYLQTIELEIILEEAEKAALQDAFEASTIQAGIERLAHLFNS